MAAAGSGTVGTAEYIQSRAQVEPNGCILWTSSLSQDGYGKAVVGYRGRAKPIRRYAHRVAYEMWKGDVPEGLELDHLCRNRRCINPDHLEPVNRKENVRRGQLPELMRDPNWRPKRRRVDVCINGHPMSGDNLGFNGKRRWCRSCKKNTSRRLRMKIAKECAAQGDVIFQRVDSIPEQFKKTEENGRIVCAHSETGHDHAIHDKLVSRFVEPGNPWVCYLQISGEFGDVVHHRSFDTHETVRLLKGIWKIKRQREHTPEGLRMVQD